MAEGDKKEEATEEEKDTEEKTNEATEASEKPQEPAEDPKEEPSAGEAKEEPAEPEEKDKEKAPEVKEEVKEEIKEVPKPEPEKDLPAGEAGIKVSGKLADIIKEIEGLSVLELADLVKALEQKFGVSAAAPVAAAPAGRQDAGGEEEAPDEVQTTFNVVLAEAGANKISVIKAVRELVPTLGLKEAKDLVDSAPKPVLEGAGKDAAGEAKQKLEAAGAKVELQ